MDNLITKIKSIFKKKEIDGSSVVNPHKHWIRILWVFSSITVVLIIFSFYLLINIKNDSVFQVAPTVKEDNSAINEKLLNSITNVFDEKEVKEKTLKSSLLSYPDPSL